MKPAPGWATESEHFPYIRCGLLSIHTSAFEPPTYPSDILINISEGALLKLVTTSLDDLVKSAQAHMRRIYPNGTRIRSNNFNPLEFWNNGSHIASLNWQHYDVGMQINEGMFVGSPGWVLKPSHMIGTGAAMPGKIKLAVDIAGVSSCMCRAFLFPS